MAEVPNKGLLDLEKELTCSICTDVLYQPQTLLDCLHTFCGSCLKVWFSVATGRAANTSNRNARPSCTCPSCRAVVRETRQNATVTTLLDMFLEANPDRRKTEAEKAEIAALYKPGDDIIPKQNLDRFEENGRGGRGEGSPIVSAEADDEDSDEADRRLIEEVREMSIHDANGRSGRSSARRMEHQSSLRSLMNVSRRSSVESLGFQEIEDEIMRDIMAQNLFEGIDLTNINEAQEQEISNRITAWLGRQEQRDRYRRGVRTSTAAQPSTATQPSTRENISNRPEMRSASASTGSASRAHPPSTRPHLFGATNENSNHRRSVSQDNRRSLGPQDARRSSETARNSASRSATDLIARPPTLEAREERPSASSQERASTHPEQPRRVSELWQRRGTRGPPNVRTPSGDSTSTSSRTLGSGSIPIQADSNIIATSLIAPAQPINGSSTPRSAPLPVADHLLESNSSNRPTPPAPPPRPRSTLFTEPTISCSSCQKAGLEYQLHYCCRTCNSGSYYLCRSCYRLGKGCPHWYGFGYNAWVIYRQSTSTTEEVDTDGPHILNPQMYKVPKKAVIKMQDGRSMTEEDPKHRLQRGVFCDNCLSNANDRYWQCDWCNDGEWGFCNTCVNQGKCCSHPLKARICQPVSAYAPSDSTNPPTVLPVHLSTGCNHCGQLISPSQPHFHCPSASPSCNNGDYDLHMSCYQKMNVSTDDWNWRRCPSGHRMQIIGFIDELNEYYPSQPQGELRRCIAEDIIGGWAYDTANSASAELTWKEGDGSVKRLRRDRSINSNESSAGPSTASDNANVAAIFDAATKAAQTKGRGVAQWPWYPALDDDSKNRESELNFPKGAEIQEIWDVNGDWYEGVYCARRGLFPVVMIKLAP